MLVKVIVTTVVSVFIAGAGVVATTVDTHTKVNANSLAGYSKEQCKHGGWRDLGFKNQGQCVAFFASGGKNLNHGPQ
jgi:hypothetical protein